MPPTWDKNRRSSEETNVLAELAVLRTAADESARHVRMLYFTFLLSAFYVAVIALSTTDEQLLKGTGTSLPLLDLELPLFEFYVVVPLLVLIFHAHLLNQFFLLSRKLFRLDHELSALPPKLETTQRELLFPLIFIHLIIGTHHPRLIRLAFRAAVMVTILLLPLVLLTVIQWKFLPYHGWWVTFVHQLSLTLDLLLLWIFWPRLSSPSGRWWVRSRYSWLRRMWGALASMALLLGIWFLLVPPGSGIKRLVGYQPWLDGTIHRNLELRERTLMRKDPLVELLFAAHVKTDEERARIWREAGEALDLRRRDLRHADFSESNLWNADLRGAKLQNADLIETKLQGANLKGVELQGADIRKAVVYGTEFQGAELSLADLRGLHSSPFGSERAFSAIEDMEDRLEQEGKHWFPDRHESGGFWFTDGRKSVARAIDRFWSIAFDLPLKPTAISPLQGFDVMHYQEGLFATWPAPPDAAGCGRMRPDAAGCGRVRTGAGKVSCRTCLRRPVYRHRDAAAGPV